MFEEKHQNLKSLALSTIFIAIFALLNLYYSPTLFLSDEGYLWYGAQQTFDGFVPMLDFMAYDPGRYYFAAGFMHLLQDDGLIALRIANTVFYYFGLFVASMLFIDSDRRASYLDVSILLIFMILWGNFLFKSYDITGCVLAILIAYWILKETSYKHLLLCGVLIGLVGFIGRNHGAYAFFAAVLSLLHARFFLRSQIGLFKALCVLGAGMFLGAFPFFLMVALIPGFFEALLESVLFLLEIGGTNLASDFPLVEVFEKWEQMSFVEVSTQLALTGFFLLITLLPLPVYLRYRKGTDNRSLLLIAASFTQIAYLHYAYARSDVAHAAFAIPPTILIISVLLVGRSRAIKATAALAFAAYSFLAQQPHFMAFNCAVAYECFEVRIGGDTIIVYDQQYARIEFIRDHVAEYAPAPDDSVLFLPFWPGAYSLIDRRSPTWELHNPYPRRPEFEKTEIARLEEAKTKLIIFQDFALDGDERNKYPNTHPLIYAYINQNFRLVEKVTPNFEIMDFVPYAPMQDDNPDVVYEVYVRK